jgi:transcriptional regulator with XRE-family HTH domain
MDDRQLGALIRAARIKRHLRQVDLAVAAGVGHSTVSAIESGRVDTLSLATLRRIAAVLQIRVQVRGWWRGGDGERLLSRRHSLLANAVAAFLTAMPGWVVEAEVSFSIWGERGAVDLLAWHAATGHLLVIEIKTEFADVGEMLGTLDRKARLATRIAEERGWHPGMTSVWLVVASSRTNRRHAAEHATLLSTRFRVDGRSFAPFLRHPTRETFGLAFWTDAGRHGTRLETHAPTRAVRLRKASSGGSDGAGVTKSG